ncbi:penicillin-binding protein [Egibacter rhizosphaerae]|uniref:Penicillin-binding protein n=1 Tax=Egibacter rhizosphaerae TaxID=1670831 RepID=A0A411YD77_9ACTN|nr:transglycosylase domain-containing protein [Egibacter rhizosphaerae]QBI19179.1 penicillin-binding protein [Egibacter rhizosphaerae]
MRRTTLSTCLGLLVLGLAGCASPVRLDLPDLDAEPQSAPVQSEVYDASGERIAIFRTDHREPVRFAELPEVLVAAVIAAEDRRFYEHGGVDARSIARAAIANQRAGAVVQGGSTITQQLAKNRYLPEAEPTLDRKVTEARLALELEDRMSKDAILADYLNTIYFGEGAYGIAAAARTYFDTDVADLDLAQSALLAGIIPEPVRASPHHDPERARQARAEVLRRMVETGAIDRPAADEAATAELGLADPPEPAETEHPFFVDLVRRELLADPRLGDDPAARFERVHGGGLRIETTIDPEVQAAAEEAVATHREQLSTGDDDPEVAAAVLRPGDGHVLAVVGGSDHDERPFDLATQGRRQPGSAFKPFALIAALEDGYRPGQTIDSGSVSLTIDEYGEPWRVRSNTSGPMPLDRALEVSSNGAYARLGHELGGGRIAEVAQRLGIDADLGTHPALALGGLREGVTPLELAASYATVAAGGVHAEPRAVARVTDSDGRTVIDDEPEQEVVLDEEVAWHATEALRGVVLNGTGQLADPGRPALGKTGTSQGYRDAWFAGATPELAASVWIGHPDRARRLEGPSGAPIEGGSWPARIWRDLVVGALGDGEERDFPYPEHLEVTRIVDDRQGCVLDAAPGAELVEAVDEGEAVRGFADAQPVVRTRLPGELPERACPEPTDADEEDEAEEAEDEEPETEDEPDPETDTAEPAEDDR